MQVARETPRKTGQLYLSTALPTLRRPLTRKVGFYSIVIIPVFFLFDLFSDYLFNHCYNGSRSYYVCWHFSFFFTFNFKFVIVDPGTLRHVAISHGNLFLAFINFTEVVIGFLFRLLEYSAFFINKIVMIINVSLSFCLVYWA